MTFMKSATRIYHVPPAPAFPEVIKGSAEGSQSLDTPSASTAKLWRFKKFLRVKTLQDRPSSTIEQDTDDSVQPSAQHSPLDDSPRPASDVITLDTSYASYTSSPLACFQPQCTAEPEQPVRQPIRTLPPKLTRRQIEFKKAGVLLVLEALDDVDDLFNAAMMSRRVHQVYKDNEFHLIQHTLLKQCPAAWQFLVQSFRGKILDVPPHMIKQRYRKFSLVISELIQRIGNRCEPGLRRRTMSSLYSSSHPNRAQRLSATLWSVAYLCELREDTAGQLIWLRQFSTRELEDVEELWSSLRALLDEYAGYVEEARESGILDDGSDTHNTENRLNGWLSGVSTMGLDVIARLAAYSDHNPALGFIHARLNGWTECVVKPMSRSDEPFLLKVIGQLQRERRSARVSYGLPSSPEPDSYVGDMQIETAEFCDRTFDRSESGTQMVDSRRSSKDMSDDASDSELVAGLDKCWQYSNARIRGTFPSYSASIPTWILVGRAAQASLDAARPPQPNRAELARSGQRIKTTIFNAQSVDNSKLLIVAIRGSKLTSLNDFVINSLCAPLAPTGFLDDESNSCHTGLLRVAQAMVAPVAEKIRTIMEEKQHNRGSTTLLLTGHSAGAAVASLLYMHMHSKHIKSPLTNLSTFFSRIHCITFGQPPIVQTPVSRVARATGVWLNFVNEGDPVPRMSNKVYVRSVFRMKLAAPPAVKTQEGPLRWRKSNGTATVRSESQGSGPEWPVPGRTYVHVGRLILLRESTLGQESSLEAVQVPDACFENTLFADVPKHWMNVYSKRVNRILLAAVLGVDSSSLDG